MSMDLKTLENGASSEPEESNTRWEGYSNYEAVSYRVAQSVDSALEAYSRIDSAHVEGAKVSPELAAEARGRILAAAVKLVPEMSQDQGSVKEYNEILNRWQGDDGYIRRLNEIQLQNESPGWLFQMVLDIRTAAWELGYLQAGRKTRTEESVGVEEDVNALFEGLDIG